MNIQILPINQYEKDSNPIEKWAKFIKIHLGENQEEINRRGILNGQNGVNMDSSVPPDIPQQTNENIQYIKQDFPYTRIRQ